MVPPTTTNLRTKGIDTYPHGNQRKKRITLKGDEKCRRFLKMTAYRSPNYGHQRFKVLFVALVFVISIHATIANAIHPELSSLLDCTEDFCCRNITVMYGPGYAECCKIRQGTAVEVKCFPQFIIAGANKCGTTALSAFMASLPYISFHTRKEAHYYDADREDYMSGKRGRKQYLQGFPSWNYSNPQNYYHYPPMFAEASPSYLASRDTPRRMVQHLPNVKLIFLLREPVSRAWSEYQMKQSFAPAWNRFVSLTSLYGNVIYGCILTIQSNRVIDDVFLLRSRPSVHELMRWDDIRECILQKGLAKNENVSQILEHRLYGTFVNSFNIHIRKKMGFNATKFRMGFTHAVNTCFDIQNGGVGNKGFILPLSKTKLSSFTQHHSAKIFKVKI